ncbi:MAG: hypothetical protein ITG00_08375 [Flavobacterium sp.]|nr:hypothetical protein [Flavobacterium sp.]
MMKLMMFAFAVFVALPSNAQSYIQKKDGSRIAVAEGGITVDPARKRILYTPYGKDAVKLKYKEIDSARIGNSILKVCNVAGKERAYYVLARQDGKALLAMNTVKTRPAGGYEQKYTRHELIIADTSNKVLYESGFSDSVDDTNTKRRLEAVAAIKEHFEQCPEVLQRLAAYELIDNNVDIALSKFLKVPVYTECN